MIIELTRFSYARTETEGMLRVGSFEFATIEKPWVPYKDLGGTPFKSCIPDGRYVLEPWVRATSGRDVYIMSAPSLGVYRQAADRPRGVGRYLCLIHTGNFVGDVVGCIAIGMTRSIVLNTHKAPQDYERGVGGSNAAMKALQAALGKEVHELVINSIGGARGTA